jgi:hypothetical protein
VVPRSQVRGETAACFGDRCHFTVIFEPNVCQDRLGTNIGNVNKKAVRPSYSNLRRGATLAVGAQVLSGSGSGERDPSQYFTPQLQLVQLQERLRSLEEEAAAGANADDDGGGTCSGQCWCKNG